MCLKGGHVKISGRGCPACARHIDSCCMQTSTLPTGVAAPKSLTFAMSNDCTAILCCLQIPLSSFALPCGFPTYASSENLERCPTCNTYLGVTLLGIPSLRYPAWGMFPDVLSLGVPSLGRSLMYPLRSPCLLRVFLS